MEELLGKRTGPWTFYRRQKYSILTGRLLATIEPGISQKVNEKGLASAKRCEAFFLGEGFEDAVYQIPRPGQKACQSFRR